MSSDLIFDAWEPLIKAEKAEILSGVAKKLAGKDIKNISFTCAHPAHAEPVEHVLGSVEGNMHFLLGYANSEFALEPYHFQVMDPTMSDEDAEILALYREKYSLLWPPGLVVGPEGESKTPKYKTETVTIGAGEYKLTGPIVSFKPLSALYPRELLTLSYMQSAVGDSIIQTEAVEPAAKSLGTFSESVYDFVKSKFPPPGSKVPVRTDSDEVIYGLVRSDKIEFVNRLGEISGIELHSVRYTEFDLTKGGNTHPSLVLNFAEHVLGVNVDLVKSFTE